jgi:hypothetical protein
MMTTDSNARTPWLWVALLSVASLGFSFALACAVPLAAFAVLAALYMDRRVGVELLGAVWLINQAVGYAFLDYPMDASTFAWGIVLGASAIVAMFAARGAAALAETFATQVLFAFAAAFVGYEGTLYLAHFPLGGETSAYAAPVVAEILWTNALALVGLLALHKVATRIGVAPASSGGALSHAP